MPIDFKKKYEQLMKIKMAEKMPKQLSYEEQRKKELERHRKLHPNGVKEREEEIKKHNKITKFKGQKFSSPARKAEWMSEMSKDS